MKTGLAAILFIAACTSSSNNGPACGDGTLDTGEQCDDGNNVSGDGCSSTCTIETPANVCGDGTVGGNEQCDDGNTTSGDGCSKDCRHEFTIGATWAFKSFSSGTVGCPIGYDTAAFYSQEVDTTGTAIGQPTIDLFTCSDLHGTTGPLPSGHYDVWIAVTTTSNSSTWGQSVDAAVDLTTASATYAADMYTDGGYFAWKWQLVGASTGNVLSCADAGADAADLTTTPTAGGQPVADPFSCTDGQGVTAALPGGSYSVSASALDASMSPLGTPIDLPNKLINNKNAVTNLGTIQLQIDGK